MEEIIETTRQILQPQIRKPKMSDKLLGRPPFRFIHDIIFNLSAATGWPDLSIFDESEMVGKAIKDRGAKIAFLEKAVAAVEQASGQQVRMRPSKAVAGQESDTVNEFLQLLGRTAANGGGSGGGSEGKDDGGGKEAEAEAEAAAAAAAAQAERERQRAEAEQRQREAEQARRRQEEDEARRRQEEEARAAAAAAAAAAAEAAQADAEAKSGGGGKEDDGGADDIFAGPMFVNEDMNRTAALMSSLISKPRMTQKLLGRPPYRFIHDIVARLGARNGFAEGLLEGDELNAKTKDRDVKLSFLTKVINLVGLHLGVPVRAHAAKVAAGKETGATNEFLQQLAYAANRGDTRDTVARVLAGEQQGQLSGDAGPSNNDDDAADAAAAAAAAQQQAAAADAERQRQAEQRRREEQQQAQAAERQRRDAAAAAADAARQAEEEQRKAKAAAAAAANYGGSLNAGAGAGAGAGGDDGMNGAPVGGPPGGVRRLARPTTARRRPPRVRENAQQVDGVEKKPVMAVGIMKEGEDSDSDDDAAAAGEPEAKVEDVFGNPASGAAGGAGKLTRDILDQQRAQETKNKANAEQQPKKSTGIRMGRIKKSRGGGGAFSQVDIEKLRSFIQKLCQSTNPLGKCMDYVLEDIESMKGELGAWKADYRRRCQDLETEKETTRDEIVPLQQELKAADMRIDEEVAKINTVKAKIAKNDARIQELLRMVVSW